MKLRKGEFLVELNFMEAWSLAWTIRSELKNSIKHYIDKETFLKSEKNRIDMMKFFYAIIGRNYLIELAMEEFDKMFEEKTRKGGEN